METFKPVRINEYFLKLITSGLSKEIYQTMFKPIFEILNDNTVYNAKSALSEALNAGRVYYENGAFKATKNFSNAVAKELESMGAKYRNGAYYLAQSMLPLEIESIIATVAAREAAKMLALNTLFAKLIQDVGKDTAVAMFIEKAVERMFTRLQLDLEASTDLKRVPTIDIGVNTEYFVHPEKRQLDTIDKYWEETDKQIEEQKDKINQLKDQLNKLKQKKKNKGKGKGKNPPKDSEATDTNPPSTDTNPPVEETDSSSKEITTDDGKTEQDLKDQISAEENALKDLKENQKQNAPQLDVSKEIIDKRAQKIAKDYTHNMDFWVKKWKTKEIIKMREDVVKMVQAGKRTEEIKKYFMNRWGIAERKAAFLARNESGIAQSVLKATHYQDMGCTCFKWLKSVSIEKRELHLEYAKETGNQYGIGGTNIFAFDNPPIIEQIKTQNGSFVPKPNGQRGLPMQTYNCQCDLVGVKDIEYYINRNKIENAKRNIFTKIAYTVKNCTQRNHNTWRYRRFGEG